MTTSGFAPTPTSTPCSDCNDCINRKTADGQMVGLFFGTFIAVIILLAVAIGLILWKRIKVAEFLYNLQLPKVTELPQFILQRWRPPTTPPPEVYDEHILHNPTYDMEEGRPSDKDTKVAEALEPGEVYEEIPNEMDLGDNFDVYDIPECENNLVAYAMTDVSGKELFDAYAVTDISQTELQCSAYAMTGSQDGNSALSDTRGKASTLAHAENRSNSSSSDKQSAGQVSSQTDAKKMKSGTATKQQAPKSSANISGKGKVTSQPNGQKQPTKMKPPISSAKPTLRPSNRKESKEKIVPASSSDAASDVHRIKVMFKDEEDRRRSQSYAGDLDGNSTKPDTHASTRSSVRGKPKPLPKKKGLPLKDIRERGASDSGVQEYSKLNAKTQYASLEPHVGKDTNPMDDSTSNFQQESYSHLKRKTALGVLLPLLVVENVLMGIAIGLIFWKRIRVAKYLQNYEPPKSVQALLRRWRQPLPLPDLEDNIERTLHNPMYDMKEGESSKANTAEAKEPAEMYEDILDLPGPKEKSDLYDVPDVGRESLVAYATTDVSGKHMLGAYAVTEISQSENSHCGAYAVSGLLDGNSASETLECVSAEVHVENGSHSSDKEEVEDELSQRPAAESCQKDTEIGNSDNNISSPAKDQQVLQSSASASGRGKTTSQSSNGPKPPVRSKPPITSSKPSLRPSNRNESRENLVSTRTSDAASEGHRVRVMFKDEDRRRSQSYAGVRWEDGKTEQAKVLTRSAKRASLKGKPPPLSKKPSLHLKGVRERGASDSGVQEYSKLDVKNQYASLEPHVGKEMDSIDESKNNLTKESYSQLQH